MDKNHAPPDGAPRTRDGAPRNGRSGAWLFLAVVVAALGVALPLAQQYRRANRLREQLNPGGGPSIKHGHPLWIDSVHRWIHERRSPGADFDPLFLPWFDRLEFSTVVINGNEPESYREFAPRFLGVEHFRVADSTLTMSEWKAFHHFDQLLTLELVNCGLNDAILSSLEPLGTVRNLSLVADSRAPASETLCGEGLAAFRRARNLQQVTLHGLNWSDKGFDALGQLTPVEILSIRDATLNAPAIAALASLRNLKQLTLDRVSIEAPLAGFENLSQLTHLEIRNSKLHGVDFSPLQSLKRLDYCDLSQCDVDDEMVRKLAPLPALEYLLLPGTKVRGDGFATAGWANVRFVWLRGAPVTDAATSAIASMPAVEFVDLTGTETTAEGRIFLAMQIALKADRQRSSHDESDTGRH